MSPAARILVVDDEKLIRWSVSERLNKSGYTVSTAETGEEALGLIASSAPAVMLLDVRLPGIDGLETLQRALVLQPELVVVMMSAHGTVDIAVEGMKHGAIDFLTKPFALTKLDEVVRRAQGAAATRRALAAPAARQGAGGKDAIVGESPAIVQIRDLVARVASSHSGTILVEGESGTGKEVVARCIHAQSERAPNPFVSVNCAALPEHLLESELFGHERGAFTDARAPKAGLFKAAASGTIMLDEIGDMPAGGQSKLLRLLEDHTYRRVGGLQELTSDARVVAATNVDLERCVSEGRFRADLYFRLNVVRIQIPPLRERREDVAPLAAAFIARYNQELKRNLRSISPAALALLEAFSWPGNVRELRNVIERALILHGDIDELRPEHLPAELRGPARPQATAPLPSPGAAPGAAPEVQLGSIAQLEGIERQLIAEAMRKAGGNQSQAARVLGISRDTLRYRLKKHAMEE